MSQLTKAQTKPKPAAQYQTFDCHQEETQAPSAVESVSRGQSVEIVSDKSSLSSKNLFQL
jgi:hypothetical protein